MSTRRSGPSLARSFGSAEGSSPGCARRVIHLISLAPLLKRDEQGQVSTILGRRPQKRARTWGAWPRDPFWNRGDAA